MRKSRVRFEGKLQVSFVTMLLSASVLAACGETIKNNYYNYGSEGGDAPSGLGEGGGPSGTGDTGNGGTDAGSPASVDGGTPSVDPTIGGAGAGGDDSGIDPRYPDAPVADTEVEDFVLDIFGTIGNRYWFAVQDEQREAMNSDGGCCKGGGDIYQPGGGDGTANFVDHLWVTTAGDDPHTADYGKVQVRVVGGITRRNWDENNIPNLNIDADQFVKQQRIADYEHLRFSNGLVGSIFRDHFAYSLYRALDYPAPLTTYAWVSSNVWGPDVSIPYTLVERYKKHFCERYANQFGGTAETGGACPNMWEFYGDFNYYGGGPKGPGGGISLFDDPNNCQVEDCDATRVKELEAKIAETPQADGFKDALSDYVDWNEFHRFQCLSWIFATSDDPIHAQNNVVLVERGDGKFQYLPYSVDISLGLWAGSVDLRGYGVLPSGCQADSTCWEETLDTCESLINDFAAIKPNEMLKTIYDQLSDAGMLRAGDKDRYTELDSWLTRRLAELPAELELYRSGNYCQYPMVSCGDHCEYYYCQDPCIPPKEPPIGGEAGAGPVIDPPMMIPPPIDPGMGVGGAGPIEPPVEGGGGPVICPMVNYPVR